MTRRKHEKVMVKGLFEIYKDYDELGSWCYRLMKNGSFVERSYSFEKLKGVIYG